MEKKLITSLKLFITKLTFAVYASFIPLLCMLKLWYIMILRRFIYRNKAQKRVTANRELPPRNEQFLIDFEQLQSQFPVSFIINTCFAVRNDWFITWLCFFLCFTISRTRNSNSWQYFRIFRIRSSCVQWQNLYLFLWLFSAVVMHLVLNSFFLHCVVCAA